MKITSEASARILNAAMVVCAIAVFVLPKPWSDRALSVQIVAFVLLFSIVATKFITDIYFPPASREGAFKMALATIDEYIAKIDEADADRKRFLASRDGIVRAMVSWRNDIAPHAGAATLAELDATILAMSEPVAAKAPVESESVE